MGSDDIFFISIIVIVVCSVIFIGVFIEDNLNNDDDVYVNVLANVSEKDTKTITTVVPVSNGKFTSMIPTTSYMYYIITDKGNVSVTSSEYNNISVKDTVVLTENLNKSSLSYNCKIIN